MNSAFAIRHSPFRIPHSAFRIPHSPFAIRHSPFPFPAVLALALLLFSCGGGWESEGEVGDKGITNDVGDSCTGLCKNEDWCYDKNLPVCGSSLCVGPYPGEMYCTQYCDTDAMCPDGFLCTWDCGMNASSHCVKAGDYDILVSLGECP